MKENQSGNLFFFTFNAVPISGSHFAATLNSQTSGKDQGKRKRNALDRGYARH
jgi:hypothetical protein